MGGRHFRVLVMTDIVESTARLADVGDSAWAALLAEHRATLRETARRRGGEYLGHTGDGLLLSFLAPTQALRCAAALVEEAAALALPVRVGVHAGEVESVEDGIGGLAVHAVARLLGFAADGHVVVSEAAVALVAGGDLTFEDLGEQQLRGFLSPWRLWRLNPPPMEQAAPDPLRWGPVAPVTRETPSTGVLPRLPLPAVVRQYAARPLVGRQDELGRLLADLDRVTAQDRRLVAVSGEAGIGKTRLAAELARTAHEQGATVLFGHCEGETQIPFSPFVTAFDFFASSLPPEQLHRRLGGREHELARLLPSLRTRVLGAASSTYEDAEFERYRLFEAVVALVELAAEDSPLVLVLDDLHWADRESLLLLKHVMRAPRQSRLLVIATAREEGVTGSHPLTQLLTDLRRDAVGERLRLRGLDVRSVETMVRDAVGTHVPSDIAQALWEQTEGHPLFLQELLRHLLETRTLVRHGRSAVRRAAQRGGVPDGVRDVVSDRLARLPAATRDVLQTAAVIGRQFTVQTLEHVSDRSPEAMHALLQPALSSLLLEPLPDAEGRYAFSHTLVREALYQEMAAHHRVALHIRIGEALERDPDEGVGEGHFSQLAHHFLEAGSRSAQYERGIDYAICAADQAAAALAFGKACDHLRQAASALAERSDQQAERCQVLLSLGENEWQAGEYLRSRRTFEQAAALAESLGLPEHLAHAAIGVGGRIGLQTSAPKPELEAMLERALRLLDDEPSPLRTRVSARLAMAMQDQLVRRDELCRAAIDQARAHGDDGLLAEVLFFAGWAQWSPDNVDERLAIADEMVSLADRSESVPLRLETRFWRMAHLLETGRIDQFETDYLDIRRLSEQARQPYHLWLVAVVRAMRAIASSVDATTGDLLFEALRSGEAAQNSAAMEVFSGQLLVAYGLADRTEEFFPAARTMTEYFQTVPLFHAGLALTYCQLGRLRDAQPIFDQVADNDFRGVPRDSLWLSTLDMLCEVCWHLGDQARAALLLDLMRPFAERNIVLGCWAAPRGAAARVVGLLHLLLRQHEEAVLQLQRAVELNQRLGVPTAEVLAQLDLARALFGRDAPGDRRAADELLAEVQRQSAARGLDAVAAGAASLWRATTPTEGAVAPTAAARPLRERVSLAGDVARSALSTRGRALVARGLSQVTDEQLDRRFAHPLAQRALFTAMARSFQPRLAFGFTGELGFELHSTVNDSWAWWTLVVSADRVSPRRRPSSRPAMTARAEVADFVRLLTGQANGIGLWIEQKLAVQGDILMGSRLVDMFGGVRLLEALPAAEDAAPGL